MQATDTHPTLTLVLSIWAGVGPLVGLVAGHFLTRSWQREQWLLDSRKQEFRELISALVTAGVELLAYKTSETTSDPQPMAVWLDAQKMAFVTIMDRIYIAEDIEKIKVGVRFIALTSTLHDGDKSGDAQDGLTKLIQETVMIARRG